MNKQEFLTALRARLVGIPQADIDRSVEYYTELLEDRIEEGMSEEAAVAALPSMDEIVSQIVAEVPLTRLVGEKLKPKRRLKGWEIAMLIVGAPLWISMLAVVFSLVVTAFAVVWSVAIVVYAVLFSFAVAGVVEIIKGIFLLFAAQFANASMSVGGGLMLVGLAIIGFWVSRKLPKMLFTWTKTLLIWIKKCFIKEVTV